jgi:hypothetical protein
VILLRDGVAVRRREPRFAGHQQSVQITQRCQRNLRGAGLEGGAVDRIELPGCHHRDDTGLQLKMCYPFGRAPLHQNTTRDPAVQWMPRIMDDGIVPDMGGMAARLL